MTQNVPYHPGPPPPNRLQVRYHPSGFLWGNTPFANNKMHGVDTWWYEDGQKRWEVYYLDNEVYAEIEWDKEGNVTVTRFPDSVTKRHSKPKPPTRIERDLKLKSKPTIDSKAKANINFTVPPVVRKR